MGASRWLQGGERRAIWWRAPLVAVVVLLFGAAIAFTVTRGAQDGRSASGARSAATAPAPDPPPTAQLRVGGAGRPVPAGFLGISMEFQAVRSYTGTDPSRVNPVLEQLIRNLSPGQAPMLRIGGDSTDASYVPGAGVRPPPYAAYTLTPGWLATTAVLAHQVSAKMVLGLNLAANDPALAGAEARAFLRAFGRGTIHALEIGNEPNIYNKLAMFHSLLRGPVTARPPSFGYPTFRRQFQAVAAATPPVALAGPALAVGPQAGPGSWVRTMPDFLAHDPRVATMTVHRYPLRNCFVPRSSAQYPTVAHLLAPYSTEGLAAGLRPWLSVAHAHHRPLRVDEINSVACRGKAGVSDTFASALWATDALFALAHAGVGGVNMHTLPNSAYELFQFSRANGEWRSWVRPVYYGLQLFAQAAPAGSRLVGITGTGHRDGLSAWATRAPDGITRVALINKDPTHGQMVGLRGPRGVSGAASVERLRAASVHATQGVTLGGRSYGRETYNGALGPPRTQPVDLDTDGEYAISVPGGSAALVTFPAP